MELILYEMVPPHVIHLALVYCLPSKEVGDESVETKQ